MDSSRTVYTPRTDATSEAEPDALSAIYRRAIERYHEIEKGGEPTAPKNAKERIEHDFRAGSIIPD